MYGKIFESIYEGSLYGQWEAIVTFQQMIVLSSSDGVVDMTPPAIAARTSIPLDIITKGLEVLQQPDRYSRSPACDGRRIELLDPARPWGWRIVNHATYRQLATREEKRAADRERMAAKRAVGNMSQVVAESRVVSAGVANVAYADADADANTDPPSPSETSPQPPEGLNPEAWSAWETYRRKIRKPIKPASVLAAQRKLAGYGDHQAAVVEHSIANGYQGLWEPRDTVHRRNAPTRNQSSQDAVKAWLSQGGSPRADV